MIFHHFLRFVRDAHPAFYQGADGKWITTLNHYLSHLKYFFRWLYNIHNSKENSRVEFTESPGNNLNVVHMKLTHVICKRQSQSLDGARRDSKRDEAGGQVSQGHEAGQGPRGDGCK